MSAPVRRVSRSFFALLALLSVLASPSRAAETASTQTPIQRLTQVAKLWGKVRYLHPYLAYREDLDWDAALLAALPKIRSAGTTEEYRAAVAGMLAALGDPVTRVLPAAEPAGAKPPAGELFRDLDGGALGIDLGARVASVGAIEALRQVFRDKAKVAAAREVVIDLRAGSNRNDVLADELLPLTELAGTIASRPCRGPAERSLIHSGYSVGDAGAASGGYFSGFVERLAFVYSPDPDLQPVAKRVAGVSGADGTNHERAGLCDRHPGDDEPGGGRPYERLRPPRDQQLVGLGLDPRPGALDRRGRGDHPSGRGRAAGGHRAGGCHSRGRRRADGRGDGAPATAGHRFDRGRLTVQIVRNPSHWRAGVDSSLDARRGDRRDERGLHPPRSRRQSAAPGDRRDRTDPSRQLRLRRPGPAHRRRRGSDVRDGQGHPRPDLRHARLYPQGTAWSIAPRINTKGAKIGAQFRRSQVSAFSAEEADAGFYFGQQLPPNDRNLPLYEKPIAMIIDDRAISQSEHSGLFFEAASDIHFVGEPTAGANGDVTGFVLPGGIQVYFTGHDVRHADGRQLQRIGLQPDVPASPTRAGIAAGRDELLEAAVRDLEGRATAK